MYKTIDQLEQEIKHYKAALKRAGWDGESNIDDFPYIIGSKNDPQVQWIKEELGGIGTKLVAISDVDDNIYVGTTGTLRDIRNGLIVVELDNGFIVEDQDAYGWEVNYFSDIRNEYDNPSHIEAWHCLNTGEEKLWVECSCDDCKNIRSKYKKAE